MSDALKFHEEERDGFRYRYLPLSEAERIIGDADWAGFTYIGDNNEDGETIAVFRSIDA